MATQHKDRAHAALDKNPYMPPSSGCSAPASEPVRQQNISRAAFMVPLIGAGIGGLAFLSLSLRGPENIYEAAFDCVIGAGLGANAASLLCSLIRSCIRRAHSVSSD